MENFLIKSRSFGCMPILWDYLDREYWQFEVERRLHSARKGRVKDPLFDIRIDTAESEIPGDRVREYAGSFRYSLKYIGMHIIGNLSTNRSAQIEVAVNGITVRRSQVKGDGKVRVTIRRATLLRFPQSAILSVREVGGASLSYRGTSGLRIEIPAGDGSLLQKAESGILINKKGYLAPSDQEIRIRQDGYLALYSDVREFFERELGVSLFLMYGTLLGVHRGGDFIPGDDDFDAGYVSDKTTPEEVKEETRRMIVALVQAGYTIIVNRIGRMFRIQRERGPGNGIFLDLRPVWFEGDHLLAHKMAYYPAGKHHFIPVRHAMLRGTRVDLPADPETILAGYYGPGWRIPDPTYVNDKARIPETLWNKLRTACLSPYEFIATKQYLESPEGNRPGMGRLISITLQELYPTEDFVE
jgi:hypothetical protein